MNEKKIGRGTFAAWTCLTLLLLAASFAYQESRVRAVDQRAASLQRELAAAQEHLGDDQTRVKNLEGELARTGKDVHRVGKAVARQAAETLNVKAVTKQALPSVVTVSCGDSQGSGFAIEVGDPPAGFRTAIVTNHHVVADCTLSNGPEPAVRQGDVTPDATLWSWDKANDLALLFVDMVVPPLATAASPEQGDPVVAIGSPYGLDESVTTGVVSQIYDDFFQTDATINPGNSGGPLLDRTGKVLGVTTFKLGEQGTNFAVRMRVRCAELISC